ncbi:hypothetical protein BDV59DRAFT_168043 [Aspergillus ambiguus]|uniref:uncharacterized protein n=1 Tax=Aspergillus ambiguus TaxID=176160 RepID=UPI003CCE0D72
MQYATNQTTSIIVPWQLGRFKPYPTPTIDKVGKILPRYVPHRKILAPGNHGTYPNLHARNHGTGVCWGHRVAGKNERRQRAESRVGPETTSRRHQACRRKCQNQIDYWKRASSKFFRPGRFFFSFNPSYCLSRLRRVVFLLRICRTPGYTYLGITDRSVGECRIADSRTHRPWSSTRVSQPPPRADEGIALDQQVRVGGRV